MNLGILTSHPIQYQAPLFRALAKIVNLHVYFVHRLTAQDQVVSGFGRPFEWDIDLLSGYRSTFLKNYARNPGVHHFFGCDCLDIGNTIYRQKFDAFMVCGWQLKAYWQAIQACKNKKIPVLVRGDAMLNVRRNPFKESIKKVLYKKFFAQFDRCLYVGQRNREYFLHYGVSPEQMYFSPNCIDDERFRRNSRMNLKQRDVFRLQLGIGKDRYLLLFVGRFVSEKRPMDLIRALECLPSSHQSACVAFVGSGPLEHQLRNSAKKFPGRIFFLGFKNQSELPRYYAASDLLVLPSQAETWGMVVSEAMACSTPAVVSNTVGCAVDLIDERQTGRSYPVGDISKLAKCIQKMMTLRTNHIRAGIEKRMENYTVKSAVRGIRQTLQSL